MDLLELMERPMLNAQNKQLIAYYNQSVDRIVCNHVLRQPEDPLPLILDLYAISPERNLCVEWSYKYTVGHLLLIWKRLEIAGRNDADDIVRTLYKKYEEFCLDSLTKKIKDGQYNNLESLLVDITPQPFSSIATRLNGWIGCRVVKKAPDFQCNGGRWALVVKELCHRSAQKLEHFAITDSYQRCHSAHLSFHLKLDYGRLIAKLVNLRTVFMPSLARLYAAIEGKVGQRNVGLAVWEDVIACSPLERLQRVERIVLPSSSLSDIIVTEPKVVDVWGADMDGEYLNYVKNQVLLTFPACAAVIEVGSKQGGRVNPNVVSHVFPKAKIVNENCNIHSTAAVLFTNVNTMVFALKGVEKKLLPDKAKKYVLDIALGAFQVERMAFQQLIYFTGRRVKAVPRHRFFIDSRDIQQGSFSVSGDGGSCLQYDLNGVEEMMEILSQHHLQKMQNKWYTCFAEIHFAEKAESSEVYQRYAEERRSNFGRKVLHGILKYWHEDGAPFWECNGLSLALYSNKSLGEELKQSLYEDAEEKHVYRLRHVKFVQYVRINVDERSVAAMVGDLWNDLADSFEQMVEDAKLCYRKSEGNVIDRNGLRCAVYQRLRRVQFRVSLRYDSRMLQDARLQLLKRKRHDDNDGNGTTYGRREIELVKKLAKMEADFELMLQSIAYDEHIKDGKVQLPFPRLISIRVILPTFVDS